MFNISKIEKETVLPYQKETINNKKIKESEQQEDKNELDMSNEERQIAEPYFN